MRKAIPDNATYRLVLVKCGKPDCMCAEGGENRHGPYCYAQWREPGTGRRFSAYVGKTLPAGVRVPRKRDRARSA